MQTTAAVSVPHAAAAAPSRIALWAGRTLSALAAIFLAMDTAVHLAAPRQAVDGTVALGYHPGVLVPLGAVEAVLLALYLFPRSALVGAVLWTGYLGGAVASQVRVGNPLASHVLFPIYVAALLWGGLYLRDRRVAALLGPRP